MPSRKSFQLTTSRRGRQVGTKGDYDTSTFQLTTSRRGRPVYPRKLTNAEMFLLTTSRRGRHLQLPPKEQAILFQLTTSRRGRQQFLRKKFSFQNHFLCSLHIIYSYYINTIFFSTLFLAKSSFFLVRIP